MDHKQKATKLAICMQDEKNDTVVDDDNDSDYETDDATVFFSHSINSDTDDDSTDSVESDLAGELAEITMTTASADAVESSVDVGNSTENIVATENGVEATKQ